MALLADRHQGDLLSPQWLTDFLDTFQLLISPGVDGLRLEADGQDITTAIREPKVSQGASLVATLRPVRQWVMGRLRQLAEPGGVIAEGHDTGTRVFPEAEVKIFLEASLKVRAHRRWLELQKAPRQDPQQKRRLPGYGRAGPTRSGTPGRSPSDPCGSTLY